MATAETISDPEELKFKLISAYKRFQEHKSERSFFLTADVALRLEPELLVGRTIRVYWSEYDAWYLAQVASYSPDTGEHKIAYDDGDDEIVIMAAHQVRFLFHAGEELPTPKPSVLRQYARTIFKTLALPKYEEDAEYLIRRVGQIRSHADFLNTKFPTLEPLPTDDEISADEAYFLQQPVLRKIEPKELEEEEKEVCTRKIGCVKPSGHKGWCSYKLSEEEQGKIKEKRAAVASKRKGPVDANTAAVTNPCTKLPGCTRPDRHTGVCVGSTRGEKKDKNKPAGTTKKRKAEVEPKPPTVKRTLARQPDEPPCPRNSACIRPAKHPGRCSVNRDNNNKKNKNPVTSEPALAQPVAAVVDATSAQQPNMAQPCKQQQPEEEGGSEYFDALSKQVTEASPPTAASPAAVLSPVGENSAEEDGAREGDDEEEAAAAVVEAMVVEVEQNTEQQQLEDVEKDRREAAKEEEKGPTAEADGGDVMMVEETLLNTALPTDMNVDEAAIGDVKQEEEAAVIDPPEIMEEASKPEVEETTKPEANDGDDVDIKEQPVVLEEDADDATVVAAVLNEVITAVEEATEGGDQIKNAKHPTTANGTAKQAAARKKGKGKGRGKGKAALVNEDNIIARKGVENLKPGDIIWAEVKGWPPWPAFVITVEHFVALSQEERGESYANVRIRKGAKDLSSYTSQFTKIAVLFFGDISRRVVADEVCDEFQYGMDMDYHTRKTVKKKAQAKAFCQLLAYFQDGELPDAMVAHNNDALSDDEEGEDDYPQAKKGRMTTAPSNVELPYKATGSLTVVDFGSIEWMHPAFHTETTIFPIGYVAERLASTPASGKGDPVPHICEILEAPDGSGPIFKVTPKIKGATSVTGDTPAKAWTALFMTAQQRAATNGAYNPAFVKGPLLQGAKMFGLSVPKIMRLIESLPKADHCERYCGWPEGFQPVLPPLDPKTLRKRLACEASLQKLPQNISPISFIPPRQGVCQVCWEEEEDEDDLMVQCDSCGIFTHMMCYGVKEAPLGRLWLCDLCAVGVEPQQAPPCALCPVTNGPLKRTSCGRWCHPTCAIWVPETEFDRNDSAKGLQGVIKDLGKVHQNRYDLTCQVCRQPYGACVQCCETGCYSAFHVICARQAGFKVEINVDEASDSDYTDSDQEEGANPNIANGSTTATLTEAAKSAAAGAVARRKGRPPGKRMEGYIVGGARLMAYCQKHSGIVVPNGNATNSMATDMLLEKPAPGRPGRPPKAKPALMPSDNPTLPNGVDGGAGGSTHDNPNYTSNEGVVPLSAVPHHVRPSLAAAGTSSISAGGVNNNNTTAQGLASLVGGGSTGMNADTLAAMDISGSHLLNSAAAAGNGAAQASGGGPINNNNAQQQQQLPNTTATTVPNNQANISGHSGAHHQSIDNDPISLLLAQMHEERKRWGCARAVPLLHGYRRGQRAPEALAAAADKRRFVVATPLLLGGARTYATSNVAGSVDGDTRTQMASSRPLVPRMYPSKCTWHPIPPEFAHLAAAGDTQNNETAAVPADAKQATAANDDKKQNGDMNEGQTKQQKQENGLVVNDSKPEERDEDGAARKTNTVTTVVATEEQQNPDVVSNMIGDVATNRDDANAADMKPPQQSVVIPVAAYDTEVPPLIAAADPQSKTTTQGEPNITLSPSEIRRPGLKSMVEKYEELKRNVHATVVPGKSAIHGWGAFARRPIATGEMVIEYIGELVRPSVADARERACYDSLVGAGTYIFRLNRTECVDATHTGNLAHLLNHSCAPNCHSRTVTVWDASQNRAIDHVVIFALRDITAWEELTYDYRFCGEEQLPCNCGAATCRGMVNEKAPESGILKVPKSKVKKYVPPEKRKALAAAAAAAAAEEEEAKKLQQQQQQQPEVIVPTAQDEAPNAPVNEDVVDAAGDVTDEDGAANDGDTGTFAVSSPLDVPNVDDDENFDDMEVDIMN